LPEAGEPVHLYSNPNRMRLPCITLFLVAFFSLKAYSQTPIGPTYTNWAAMPGYYAMPDSSSLNKKWSLHGYSGVSTSFGSFYSGNGSAFSTSIGLQLNRRLNNNFYAFAAVSASPTYYSFNQNFLHSNLAGNPGYSISGNSGFGMYTKFEAGLMYVNDAKTFSVSGSIGITKGVYPGYPAYNYPNYQKPVNSARQ
jgi:hypothetical protein